MAALGQLGRYSTLRGIVTVSSNRMIEGEEFPVNVERIMTNPTFDFLTGHEILIGPDLNDPAVYNRPCSYPDLDWSKRTDFDDMSLENGLEKLLDLYKA